MFKGKFLQLSKVINSKFTKNINFRDVDEKQIQKVCSDITDWFLRAKIGDLYEINGVKDLPEYVLHRELRNRFDSIWTHQNGYKIVIEKVSNSRRAELENSDPNETRK